MLAMFRDLESTTFSAGSKKRFSDLRSSEGLTVLVPS